MKKYIVVYNQDGTRSLAKLFGNHDPDVTHFIYETILTTSVISDEIHTIAKIMNEPFI